MNCDHCVHYIKTGETMVPWGNTMVSAGDEWGCAKDQDPDDCEFVPEEPHYTIRSHGLSEADWERADWEDMRC